MNTKRTYKFNITDPILVHQMGRVGSHSLVHVLSAFELDVPVYHVHYLNRLNQIQAHLSQEVRAAGAMYVVDQGRLFWREWASGFWKKCNLITPVRNPVNQAASAFFFELDERLGDVDVNTLPLQELVERFVQWATPWDARTWFEHQVRQVFGLDVFAVPFDYARGFTIHENEYARIVVLRSEELNQTAAPALDAFLNLPPFSLPRAYSSEFKKAGARYREFQASALVPRACLESLLDTPLARHFYTDRELEDSLRFWSRDTHITLAPRSPISYPTPPDISAKPLIATQTTARSATALPHLLILTSGKLGAGSLCASLATQTQAPIHQAHYLNRLDEIANWFRTHAADPTEDLLLVNHARILRRELLESGKRVNVITVVRDPIAQLVSTFFENLAGHIPDADARLAQDSNALSDFARSLVDTFDDHLTTWFDEQIGNLLGMDPFAHPFPHARGYQIIERGPVRLLILRLADLNRGTADKAMREFLGIPAFQFVPHMPGQDREWGTLYRRFVRSVKLPPHAVAQMLDTRYARHFFSAGERRALAQYWSEIEAGAKVVITKRDVLAQLDYLGIRRGDIVGVEGALDAIGYLDGGAEIVLEALVQVVGADGGIVMPTFSTNLVSDSISPQEHAQGLYRKQRILPFDPKTTPCWTGALANAFWQRPGVLRSAHPTHSFAASGKFAKRLIEGWDALHELDGKILLLGAGLEECRALELAMWKADYPKSFQPPFILPEELRLKYPGDQFVLQGRELDFDLLQEPFVQSGILQTAVLGQGQLECFRLRAGVKIAARSFGANPWHYFESPFALRRNENGTGAL